MASHLTLAEVGVEPGISLGLAAEIHIPGQSPTLVRQGSAIGDAEAEVGVALQRAVERRRASYRLL